MNKIIIILIAVLGLSGCVTKKYHSPVGDLKSIDSLYRTLEMQVDTTSNSGAISWREFFTDTILQAHIDTVLNRNMDFAMAKLDINKAYSELRVARAAYSPKIGSVSVGGGFDFLSNSWSAGVQSGASWEIEIWGKLTSAKRAAIAKYMSSQDAFQAMQTGLVAQMASGYYQLVVFDIEKQIILETIRNRSQYLDTIKIMKESGKVNEVAVQQAVAQLGEVLVALPQMEMAIVKTENALSLLLGKTGGEVKRTKMLNFFDSKQIKELGVPAQLLSNRPDVRKAEQDYRNAFELYNVSRAAMYPSLTISADVLLASLWQPHFATLGALATLAQPLWNGRKLRGQKEIADYGQQQAKINFEKTVLTAGKEVSDAIATQLNTYKMAQAQKLRVDAYDKAYTYSFELFVNGYATYLDVLTAQTGVFTSQMSLLNTYFDNISARIDLYRALGGGGI